MSTRSPTRAYDVGARGDGSRPPVGGTAMTRCIEIRRKEWA